MDYIIDDFCKALSVNLDIDIERIYLVWNQLNEKYLDQMIESEKEIPRSYPIDDNKCKFVSKNMNFCPNIPLTEYCKKHVSRGSPSMSKIDEE
jgi:hypothetical protein